MDDLGQPDKDVTMTISVPELIRSGILEKTDCGKVRFTQRYLDILERRIPSGIKIHDPDPILEGNQWRSAISNPEATKQLDEVFWPHPAMVSILDNWTKVNVFEPAYEDLKQRFLTKKSAGGLNEHLTRWLRVRMLLLSLDCTRVMLQERAKDCLTKVIPQQIKRSWDYFRAIF